MKPSLEDLTNVSGPVLLLGESGTGKTHWAKELHEKSKWSSGPFSTVNLATISEELLESELFGHVKGSFTGAINDKMGHIDVSKNGTLFLDEIGEITLRLQKKLLLFIDTGEYYAVGGTQKKQFKGRIIIATNRNLEEMVREGRFREDLYRRLLVFVYQFSPIRSDKGRLKVIASEIWKKICEDVGNFSMKLSHECWNFLLNYDWRGNIREIKNCLKFVAEMALKDKSEEINLSHFPDYYIHSASQETVLLDERIINSIFRPSYYESLGNFERLYFQDCLNRYGGKINDTAKIMGISKVTLINKAKKYNINTRLIKALHYQEKDKN